MAKQGSIPAGNYMFKVNNRNTRARSEKLFKVNNKDTCCLYWKIWTFFTPCSSVSIVNFEQLNAGCDIRFFAINHGRADTLTYS